MLKLSRRVGETILIGNDVEIEVLDIRRGQVQIGIRAPREVTILRKEIALTIRENAVAAQSVSDETISQVLGVVLPERRETRRPSIFPL